jgi:hypothetical protein
MEKKWLDRFFEFSFETLNFERFAEIREIARAKLLHGFTFCFAPSRNSLSRQRNT